MNEINSLYKCCEKTEVPNDEICQLVWEFIYNCKCNCVILFAFKNEAIYKHLYDYIITVKSVCIKPLYKIMSKTVIKPL